MEFHHLGSHCSYPDCKQLDFLPFKCDACDRTFCLDHRTYEAHKCRFADNTDRRALVCPICNTPIVPLPSQDPNVVLDDHINQGCTIKAPTGYKCNMKGCKKVDVMAIVCKYCRRHHCVKHRFEDAHNCPRTPQRTKPTKTANNNNNSTTNPKQPNSQIVNTNTTSNTYPGTHSNTRNSHNNSSSTNSSNSRQQSIQTSPTVNSAETTVGIRLTNGDLLRRTCRSTTTLRDIQLFIDQTRTDGSAPYIMRTTFPPKELSYSDLDKTLVQLGLVPSGMIILQPLFIEEQPTNTTNASNASNAAISNTTNNSTNSTNNTANTENNNIGWWGLVSSFFGSFMPSSQQ